MYVTHRKIASAGTENTSGIHQLWLRYFAFWPLFVILLLLAGGGAWLYLWYTPKQYESDAKILINDEKKGTEDSKEIQPFTLLDPKRIIENETEVIQTRALIDQVAKDLSLYAPVYEQHKFRQVSAYTTSPIKIDIDDVANLKETGKINFTYDSAANNVAINNHDYPLNQWAETPYGNLKFSRNPNYLAGPGIKNYYFQLVSIKKIASDIQDRLKVASTSKLSTILDISINDEVPERGDDILNTLLNNYNKQILEQKNVLASNTLQFLQSRLNNVSKNLDSVESKIQNYKASNTAVDISEQGKLFLGNVSSNDQKISEINMQLAVLDEVENYVQSKETKGGIVPSTLGVDDPVLSQLVSKLYEDELEYEKMRKTEGENFPSVVSLADQIAKLKPSILENIKNQRESLQTSKDNLVNTNNTYAQQLQTIPGKEKELIDINREQAIKNTTYAFLLQKKEETALSNASPVTDDRVIDQAQSSVVPVSPNTKAIYAIFIGAALLLGMAFITVKETYNSKVLYRQELEELTTKPIIGEIIYEKTKQPFVTGAGRGSFASEQFRQLRVALSFLNNGSKKKKILVTSSIPGEGKSFVSRNIALTLAIANKKTVLVELDLVNPGISGHFNASENLGVTDYLLSTCSEQDIIFNTSVNENLFLISSGTHVDNPSELLVNGRITKLLEYLEASFDYIIIDTPPVNLVTDAYILSGYCDVTLYVIRHNYTPKMVIKRIDANNKVNPLNNLALVFNGVRPRGFVKNVYGYGYGYGYAYSQKKKRKLAS